MTRLFAFLLAIAAQVLPLAAETLVATRRLPARTIIEPSDLAVTANSVPGTLSHPDEAVGLEARVMLYPGRPIRMSDLVSPAAVERNQIVLLIYERGGLTIATEGRSLSRAALGDRVRVMNLSSRTTVTGTITEGGTVIVGQSADLLQRLGDR